MESVELEILEAEAEAAMPLAESQLGRRSCLALFGKGVAGVTLTAGGARVEGDPDAMLTKR